MALVDQYDGIIFDYGGVLAFHQTIEDVNKMAGISGLPPDVIERLYWADRGAYDKGSLTAEDYWNDMARQAGKTFTPDQIRELIATDVESWTRFDTVMYDFVEDLASRGKRVAVLSNMPHELGESIKAQTQGFAPFHHLTLSYEVRSVKPEPDIYRHCLEGLNVAPEVTLFLDDRLENIQGAEKLGISGVQFTSRDQVLPKLTANGAR